MRTEKCTNNDAIDFVVPMVFHSDKLWQEDFRKIGSVFDENDYYGFVRYRSWGTEHLLIRCVKKFMPFVRNIYILLARESQKQDWMKEEGVHVVYHRDFIPERFLPTFNSCAIEMFLHKIPGISERFIYGNDDMFPLSPLTEEDFFRGETPCQHFASNSLPQHKNIFHKLCIAEQNFVASEFGRKWEDCLMKGGHGLTPILKKTCEWLWYRGGKEIENSISHLRASHNFCQWIYPLWHHMAGNYIDDRCPTSYISAKSSVENVVKAIEQAHGVLCINDNECAEEYKEYALASQKAIECKLKQQ